jgi:hypothetical protein
VHAHLVFEAAAESVDRVLESAVFERGDLAAPVADDVMVVLAAGVGGLVTSCGAYVDPPNEVELREQLERSIDARDADAPVTAAKLIEDLLRGQAAGLLVESLQHRRAGAAGPMPLLLKLAERVLEPSAALRSSHVGMIPDSLRVITIPIS